MKTKLISITGIFILLLFWGCTSIRNLQEKNRDIAKSEKSQEYLSDSIIIFSITSLDTLVIPNKIQCVTIIPSVQYVYTDSGKRFLVQDKMIHQMLTFSETLKNGVTSREISIAGNKLLKMNYNNVNCTLNTDSIEMNIYYTESEYFWFGSLNILLVVSKPMDWVGLMSAAFSFYQLINIDKKTVYEFIGFGDSPYLKQHSYSGVKIIIHIKNYNYDKGILCNSQ
jgi:hypothetical protein